jgi:hypothetical protein
LVDTSHGLTDERLLVELEKQVRPLVAAARTALIELTAPGRDAAVRFLDAAPTAECVRLAGIWAGATAMGLDTARVKARFSPEDQMLIEIVVSLYAPPPPSSMELPTLGSLLEDPGAASPPARRA